MTLAFRRTLTAALLAVSLTWIAAGCTYRDDLTPELASLSQTEEQDANQYARVIDNSTRSAWDDLARLFLLDHNTRLTPVNLP
ncbi:MAG: hypothetical protein AAGG38_03875 [Planctomycetota bacterium]